MPTVFQLWPEQKPGSMGVNILKTTGIGYFNPTRLPYSNLVVRPNSRVVIRPAGMHIYLPSGAAGETFTYYVPARVSRRFIVGLREFCKDKRLGGEIVFLPKYPENCAQSPEWQEDLAEERIFEGEQVAHEEPREVQTPFGTFTYASPGPRATRATPRFTYAAPPYEAFWQAPPPAQETVDQLNEILHEIVATRTPEP